MWLPSTTPTSSPSAPGRLGDGAVADAARGASAGSTWGGGGYTGPMKKLLFAMALGAALAWLFDPDAGSKRRDALRRKLDQRGLTGGTPPPVTPPVVIEDAPTLLTASR